jgi:hypothetical protein
VVSVRQLGKSLAKISVAVVFTGPVGGARETLNQAIDLFWSSTPPEGQTVTRVLRDIEDSLSAFAAGERLPAAAVERAMENASWLIGRHGLTASDLVDAGLDPQRAVDTLLRRAAPALRGMDEGDVALCTLTIERVYTAVVQHSAGLSETTTEYRRAVLRRLESLEALPEEVRVALVRSAAHGLVLNPSRTWQANYYPPSALLRAEYGAVPFWGRTDVLQDLDTWLQDERPVTTRLYVGAGGMGKTRLMLEWCRRLRTGGWRAGFLSEGDGRVRAEHLALLSSGVRGVALVVDYAETRTETVGRLVAAALDSHATVRILLLARSTADWWDRLRQLPDVVGDYLNGPAVTTYGLTPVAVTEEERQEVFRLAVDAFRRALGSAGDHHVPEDGPSVTAAPVRRRRARGLSGATYDRILFLLLKALASAEGQANDDDRALLDHALRREQRFWDDGLDSAGLSTLVGRPVRQAAALITLAGHISSYDEAVRLLATAPLLSGQPAAVLGRVAELFHRLYPEAGWMNGIQPDLLGEHLVARALEEDPTLLGVFVAS